MSSLIRASLAVFVVSAITSITAARDLFVNNLSGDDLFDGRSPVREGPGHGPNQTIWRALRSARAGDRIVLAKTDEPYRESISLVGSRHSGHVQRQFVIDGNGAILDGSRPVPFDAWEFVRDDIFRFQPGRMDFQQLFHNGAPLVRRPYSPIYNRKLELEPLEWSLAGGWVYFRVEKGKMPQDYHLSDAYLTTGITIYKVEGVIIDNLIVQGFAVDGINLNDAVGPTILTGVISRGNGRSGVTVTGVSKVDLQGCLLGDNGQSQLLVQEFGNASVSNCDLLDNTGPKWEVKNGAKLLMDGKSVQNEAAAPTPTN
jgi:hypothetical protein